jgi:hypothetical protein
MRGRCVKCSKPFSYESLGRKRVVCDKCLRENLKSHMLRRRQSQKSLETEEGSRALDAAGISLMNREQVAKLQGVSTKRVHQIERDALAKIRNHPEAKKLFKFWMQEGCPTTQHRPKDPAEALLEWHMSLAEWWGLYDEMCLRGLSNEAQQCQAQIKDFYALLRKAMHEFDPYPYEWVKLFR